MPNLTITSAVYDTGAQKVTVSGTRIAGTPVFCSLHEQPKTGPSLTIGPQEDSGPGAMWTVTFTGITDTTATYTVDAADGPKNLPGFPVTVAAQ